MLSIRLVCCAVLLVVVATQATRVRREKDKYTTEYDNINLDEILKSDRLFNSYLNCLLDKGKCSPSGLELKNNLPDALQNDCSKCSEKQRVGAEKVLRFVIKNRRAAFEELEKKYDPNGAYRKKYEKEFNEHQDSKKKP